ncbi:MAG: hypothetical protein A2487_13440 [Candidatus Raymondbacteria bacterium RifOxyC12_full_50_8]|uniref:Uncharacterized protein n=1 Tax=Candidatus Raymondbacteria bacterium RIFOXYD12_FULL_49_13 TaxID=1817890 RepID=A0A1F7F7W5_UNCRA|nr:MAG: hypothetical protein A2248_13550 [Candidatus Raymondbacteria bacterium RIFOXYA2_FULL_49_16]OGJ95150.1 MAG: hypothetical protein A2350_09405 [Candidatus Raymondbacteria bacterium RifOxyB12_full_50_8]OGK00362.1 MAG: hypothetical protein A2487_13440 [Candidatus Raymondbacteria bacterium RifOxyC12_full_50_8]OGK02721.1 MAG: hypothetical protein A2519_09670 [Candidatus Raymondbacteria bacterium RIFOXYD12_FULL_49_13]OGP42367.1 MAG: hypothetical protein A2324_20340 [Candidatus Raymondbacteria b
MINVTFQEDLIKQGYHLFDKSKTSLIGFYPKELHLLITELKQKDQNIDPVLGEVYSARAFFAISKPIGGECSYQSGYLDVRLIMQEGDTFIGEIQTELPDGFALKKGGRIKIRTENLIYKPDYPL